VALACGLPPNNAGRYAQAVHQLPRAILFDLDDTIICAYGDPTKVWRTVLDEHAALLTSFDIAEVTRLIVSHAREFWADPERHRCWRMQLLEARREIVRGAFAKLSGGGMVPIADEIALLVADRFTTLRDEQMHLFPDACETLDVLRTRGVALALVTNGASEPQRAKLLRFDLARRFDHIQIEGEHGFGKPEPTTYLHALRALSVNARDAWMVGDNLEWEVAAPQRLGIYAIWHDVERRGLPPDSAVRPDRTIHALSELLPALASSD
jgi:putative hydrolase of the HAD superfamily